MQRIDWKLGLIILTVVGGICLRVYFLFHMPFTNDEGAYLYDAKTILSGGLPGGDVLTKTPVAAIIFAIANYLSRGSLYAARLASAFFGIVTLLPLLLIAKQNKQINPYILSVIWLLFSAPVVLLGLGQTEPVAVFFSVITFALVLLGMSKKQPIWIMFLSGAAFALAIGSRKIDLILILPLAVLFLQQRKDISSLNGRLLVFGAGFLSVVMTLAIIVFRLYGWIGLDSFIGLGYGKIISSRIAGDPSVNIWGITTFDTLKILWRVGTAHFVVALLALVGVLIKTRSFKEWKSGGILFVSFVWLIALLACYSAWPTFLPDYAGDFLVPITLVGAWAVSKIWQQNILPINILLVIIFVGLNYSSIHSVYAAPWTGMFAPKAVAAMAAEMQKNVPSDQPVLTAATIVPYLSGHKTLFNISHPLWYRYDFIGSEEKTLFLPSWKNVSSAIVGGEVGWILMEHLTDYAYLRNADQLINEIAKNWELVASVSNDTGFRSNTLKLYRRK